MSEQTEGELHDCGCPEKEQREPHGCPFKEDVKGDYKTLCTCCSKCTRECLMEI